MQLPKIAAGKWRMYTPKPTEKSMDKKKMNLQLPPSTIRRCADRKTATYFLRPHKNPSYKTQQNSYEGHHWLRDSYENPILSRLGWRKSPLSQGAARSIGWCHRHTCSLVGSSLNENHSGRAVATKHLPSLKLAYFSWKWMVGILMSFLGWLVLGRASGIPWNTSCFIGILTMAVL